MTKPTAEPNARRPQPGRGEGMSQSGAEQSLIELSRIGEGKELDRYELQAVLRERIGVAALLAASSDDTLAQLAREQFEPEAPADTDAFCQEVLARLDEQRECQSPAPFVRQFVRRVLGFRVPPAQKRQELLDAALLDLARLEELIAFYENLQAVVSHMGGERPRGQEAAMHVDFYRRCLEERDAISRYVTSGVNDEAIRRSDDVDNFRSALSGVVSLFAEVPPYRLRHPRGEEHLDFKRINRWRHRVRTLPIGRGRDLGALYESGELRAFYQELAGERPGSTLFDIIHRSVQMVPKLEERRANFDELHELYDAGRWRGFYALALPRSKDCLVRWGRSPSRAVLGARGLALRYPRRSASFATTRRSTGKASTTSSTSCRRSGTASHIQVESMEKLSFKRPGCFLTSRSCARCTPS